MVPTLPTPISSQSSKARTNKGIQIGKEVVKVSLFIDDIISYLTDLKCSTKKRLQNMKNFSTTAGFKINLQKSVAY
jgi:hypothetical protein